MGTASNGGCSCSCGFSQEAILRLLQENTCLIQRINALTETLEIPKFIGVIDAQNQSLDLVVALLKPYPTLANLLETQAENVFSVLPNVAKRQDGGKSDLVKWRTFSNHSPFLSFSPIFSFRCKSHF